MFGGERALRSISQPRGTARAESQKSFTRGYWKHVGGPKHLGWGCRGSGDREQARLHQLGGASCGLLRLDREQLVWSDQHLLSPG